MKLWLKNPRVLVGLSLTLIAVGAGLRAFAPEAAGLDFPAGFLMGVGLVFAVAALTLRRAR